MLGLGSIDERDPLRSCRLLVDIPEWSILKEILGGKGVSAGNFSDPNPFEGNALLTGENRYNLSNRKVTQITEEGRVCGGLVLNPRREIKGSRQGRRSYISLAQEKRASEVMSGKQSSLLGVLRATGPSLEGCPGFVTEKDKINGRYESI